MLVPCKPAASLALLGSATAGIQFLASANDINLLASKAAEQPLQ